MSKNTQPPKKKRSFLGKLWRTVAKNAIPLGAGDALVGMIDGDVDPNPSEIIKAVTGHPTMSQDHKDLLIKEANDEMELRKLELQDMENARDMYKSADNSTANKIAMRVINYNLWVVMLAIAIEVLTVIYMEDKTLIAIISAAIGGITTALLQERQQVINFFFGSSLGSKKKTDQLSIKKTE